MPLATGGMVPVTEARDRFAELVNRAAYGKERLILGRRGKPLVALVPVVDVSVMEAIKGASDVEVATERHAVDPDEPEA